MSSLKKSHSGGFRAIPEHVLGLALYRMDQGQQPRFSASCDDPTGTGVAGTVGARDGCESAPDNLIHRTKAFQPVLARLSGHLLGNKKGISYGRTTKEKSPV